MLLKNFVDFFLSTENDLLIFNNQKAPTENMKVAFLILVLIALCNSQIDPNKFYGNCIYIWEDCEYQYSPTNGNFMVNFIYNLTTIALLRNVWIYDSLFERLFAIDQSIYTSYG